MKIFRKPVRLKPHGKTGEHQFVCRNVPMAKEIKAEVTRRAGVIKRANLDEIKNEIAGLELKIQRHNDPDDREYVTQLAGILVRKTQLPP